MSGNLQRLYLDRGPQITVFALCLAFAGCSGGGIAGLYPVSGTVTYLGKPVEGATVSFINKGEGRPATAVTKVDGSYQLYTLDSKGALPGSYSVLVSKFEALSEEPNKDPGFDPVTGQDLSMEQSAANAGKRQAKAKELIPAKYGSQQTTPLTFDVQDSKNVFDLKLE